MGYLLQKAKFEVALTRVIKKIFRMNPVVKQLLREFQIQFVLSIFWGIFKTDSTQSGIDYALNFIGNFTAAFFLTSWFASQILRVKKQQHVENSLNTLISKLEVLANALAGATKKLWIVSSAGTVMFFYRLEIFHLTEESDN